MKEEGEKEERQKVSQRSNIGILYDDTVNPSAQREDAESSSYGPLSGRE